MIHDYIGIGGVILCLIAYLLIQSHKVTSHNLGYILLNMFGSLGIMISLFYAWNLSAFLMEVSWLLISLYGLWTFVQQRKQRSRGNDAH